LNDPPPQKRSSLSISPQNLESHSSSSSSNLDYLLEDDDEEPPKSGAWKIVLIVVVLAVAATLGYMRWKNQSFGWLTSGSSKSAATTPPSDTADSNAPDSSAGSAAAPSSTPPSSPSDTTPAPANPASNPAPDKSTPVESPVASVPAPDKSAASHPPVTPPAPRKKKKAELADPNLSPPIVATRRTPAPAPPAKLGDSITEAQKYIYGKGVQQDCDRGLRLLKPAADHANPKAMIEMGALYSAGLCTPHDLPTAYRWFALALRKEPDNQSVQTDLQKLWGEMTQPERQLAIKLSQ
jgi:TPR repeat protein